MVIFLHIPKTAGTTLKKWVTATYPSRDTVLVYPVSDGICMTPEQFRAMPQERIKRLKVIVGHVQYGAHRTVLPRRSRYVTMLRDPVERVVSEYYHHRRCNDSHLHTLVNGTSALSLEDYATLDILPLDNVMVRYIAGINAERTPHGHCSESDLDLAKYRLQNDFWLTLITESFSEGMALLENRLDLQGGDSQRCNVNPHRPALHEIDNHAVNAIRDANRLDIALYKFATQVFEECRMSECMGRTCQASGTDV